MALINKYCDICGKRQAVHVHHTISGTAGRAICDSIGGSLLLNLCATCHSDIHNHNTAAKLSKMYGQAMYEKDHSREEFKKLFGINYLP